MSLKGNWCVRGLLLFLVAALLLSSDGYALWDGYVESSEESASLELLDLNNMQQIFAAGAVPNDVYTKSFAYSAYWNPNRTTLNFQSVPRDWTEFSKLELWLYSEKATNTTVGMLIDTVDEQADGPSYFSYFPVVDWKGWKKFDLKLNSDLVQVRAAKYSEVLKLQFISEGWGLTPDPETKLYIGGVKLYGQVSGKHGGLENNYYQTDITEVKELLQNAVAIHAGSPNVLDCGEVKALSSNGEPVKAGSQNGTATAPVDFFETYLGCKASERDGGFQIELSGHTLIGSAGSPSYLYDGQPGEFETAPQQDGSGRVYLPAAETGTLLGRYMVVNEGLTVFGTDNSIDRLLPNGTINILSEIAAQLTAFVFVDPATVKPEDFKVVKDKWRYMLVGDTHNLESEYIASKIKGMAENGRTVWKSLKKGSGIVDLFGDAPMVTSADLTDRFTKVNAMAQAYAAYGSELYHNEQLLKDTLYALDWLFTNRYGQAELDGTGWRSTGDYDWFDWQIAAPKQFMNTMLLLEEHLTKSQIDRYLMLFDHLVPDPTGIGSNKINFGKLIIAGALLREDAEKLIRARDLMDDTFFYVDNGRNGGEGFYSDGTYIYHGKHVMNGVYGKEHFSQVIELASLLAGSRFEFTNPQVNHLFDWFYQAYEPIVYKGYVMRMFNGRAQSYASIGRSVVSDVIKLLDFARTEEDVRRIKAYVKYMALSDTTNNYYSIVGLESLARFIDIMEDEAVAPRADYRINKVYYNGDKVMHQRGDFAVGISMFSSRTYDYESINNENLQGWYLTSGMVNVYNDDLSQYDQNYWQNVDPYRLPGTTVDTQERDAVSIAQAWTNHQDFVGGVTLGEYGAAAMQLEAYSNSAASGADWGEHGGNLPEHTSTLMAKKAWFLFDDEVVALGSGINANDDADVLTVIENRKSNHNESLMEGGVNEPYSIAGVEASDVPEPENVPENTIDGNTSTRWAAENECSITWDLGEVKQLGFITLSFMNGGLRQTIFDLEVSKDGQTWQQVFSGRSSGTTELPEAYDLKNSQARYVRYSGHGNTTGSWNSITTATVYPPNADGTVEIPKVVFRGKEAVTVDGSVREIGGESVPLDGAKWIHLEETGGYYFPEEMRLKARKTENALSFFELWTEHGANPKDQSYLYVQLPNKTAEETKAYAQNPDVEILCNTPQIQAVREKRLGMTGIVFWEPGTFEGVTVSEPMILMLREQGGSETLAVSDPTHKLKEATVLLPGKKRCVSSDRMLSAAVNGGATQVKVNFDGSAGRTMTAEFETGGNVTVQSISFKNEQGKPLEAPDGSRVMVSAEVENRSAEDRTVTLIAARCDGRAVLNELQTDSRNLESGGRVSLNAGFRAVAVGEAVKAFVWDDLGSMRPYAPAAVLGSSG